MAVNEKAVALARARDDTPNKPPQAPAPGTREIRRPGHMVEASTARNVWVIRADEGVQTTDLASARFLGHLQPKLRPGDRIEVTAHDGSWLMELLVRASEAGSVRTFVLHRYDFATAADRAASVVAGHSIQYGSEQTKWRIVRQDDKQVIREGFADAGVARAWLESHLAKMGEPASIT
jgi:hypothetical protein